MSRTLVLNTTYEPLGVVGERRGLILILNQRACSVVNSERLITYSKGSIALPAVIRLNKFVKIPYRQEVPLSRRAIFARDNHRCVYCGATASSIDHVVPKSRGGGHVWENVVSACHKCNHDKDDLSLQDLGWKLKYKPKKPMGVTWRILGSNKPHPVWVPYLKPFGVESVSA